MSGDIEKNGTVKDADIDNNVSSNDANSVSAEKFADVISTVDTGTDGANDVCGGTLYLVSTPIGNLADLSSRAIKVLREADFIAAEDTRRTGRLLAAIGVKQPMTSYHEHNKKESGERIIKRLMAGESCALCTDAGVPGISDPGADLVALCAGRGIPVVCIPGPCAAITALAVSGADTHRFVFEGFLPTEAKQRQSRLAELSREERTAVIYESPHRLKKTLSELRSACGGSRKITLCRELTKLNEEVIRTDLDGAVSIYSEREPRGEYVLVLHGADNKKTSISDWSCITVAEHVAFYEAEGLSRMEAIKAVARDRGVSKGIIYKELIK
ncbi:MAG: 16S rRNA (cytidine(1402)-2'-O)-methyltransferase [Eubacteriales bacterium]|jgi:16S rRNA (cytidine1402-2'-O)-methyltransferase|nr:16S rRNA (cytidine(1402)-2'-O)-methyltransferase [Clostridiales bacterium]